MKHNTPSLLTTGNPKVAKGESLGYLTAILHLAPADSAGLGSVCPWASPACIAACLNTAGRGGIIKKGETTNAIQECRKARTRYFFEDRAAFLARLRREIAGHERLARKHGLRAAVRLNGTSDIPWESVAPDLFAEFPTATFYDYTKAPHRIGRRLPPNYSLTFSRSETNEPDAVRILESGGNVAVVFDRLPERWNGFRVINGDATDLRFLDPRGVVVGLTAKGKAKRDTSGFVVRGAQ